MLPKPATKALQRKQMLTLQDILTKSFSLDILTKSFSLQEKYPQNLNPGFLLFLQQQLIPAGK